MRIPLLLVVMLLLGCQEGPVSQRGGAVDGLVVPEPELVPYSNIPHPVPKTLYRISGAALAEGPRDVLERVLHAGIDVRRAWHPEVVLCLALFLDELIVELAKPDDEIYELGFTSEFSGTIGPCASHWNEYNFVKIE